MNSYYPRVAVIGIILAAAAMMIVSTAEAHPLSEAAAFHKATMKSLHAKVFPKKQRAFHKLNKEVVREKIPMEAFEEADVVAANADTAGAEAVAQAESQQSAFNVPECKTMAVAQNMQKFSTAMDKQEFSILCPLLPSMLPCYSKILQGFGFPSSFASVISTQCEKDAEGKYCGRIMNESSSDCEEKHPYYCTGNCMVRTVPGYGDDSKVCVSKVTSTVASAYCSSCLTKIINVFRGVLREMRNMPKRDGVTIDMKGAPTDAALVNMQQVTRSVCTKVPNSNTKCLDAVPFFSGGTSMGLTKLLDDTDDNLLPDFSNTLMTKACSDFKHKVCFRKVTFGLLAVQQLETDREDINKCATKFTGITNYYTRRNLCRRRVIIAKMKRLWFLKRSAAMCLKTGSNFCFAVPGQVMEKHSTFASCLRYAYNPEWCSTNYTNCGKVLKTGFTEMGCCARRLWALPGTSVCSTLGSLEQNSTLPEACPMTVGPKVKKMMKLGISYAKVQSNATLKTQMVQDLTRDTATDLGVPDSYIVNGQLVDEATAAAAVKAAPASSVASRGFRTLSDSKAAFTFDVQGSDQAETEAVVSAYESAEASGGITTPTTNAALQSDGVISEGDNIGGSAAADNGGGSSSSGGNIGIIIGIVIGVVVVVGLIGAIVFLMTKSKGPANQPAGNNNYQPMQQVNQAPAQQQRQQQQPHHAPPQAPAASGNANDDIDLL